MLIIHGNLAWLLQASAAPSQGDSQMPLWAPGESSGGAGGATPSRPAV